MANLFRWTIKAVVVIWMPITLISGAVTIISISPTPIWLQFEAGISKGNFTLDQRVHITRTTTEAVRPFTSTRKAATSLQRMSAPDDEKALFTQREIRHLLDVKAVLGGVGAVFLIGTTTLIASYLAARRLLIDLRLFWKSIFAGSCFAVFLVAGLSLFAINSWGTFFVGVHKYLFTEGSYIFLSGSAVTELFPARYWMLLSVIVLVSCLTAIVVSLSVSWLFWRQHRHTKIETGPTPQQNQ